MVWYWVTVVSEHLYSVHRLMYQQWRSQPFLTRGENGGKTFFKGGNSGKTLKNLSVLTTLYRKMPICFFLISKLGGGQAGGGEDILLGGDNSPQACSYSTVYQHLGIVLVRSCACA